MTYTEEELEILRAQHRERVARCTRDIQAHWKEKAELKKLEEEEAELKKLEEEKANE